MAKETDSSTVPEMKLELVPVPVADTDRAKEFYERIGFGNIHDTQVTPQMRVVQFTPRDRPVRLCLVRAWVRLAKCSLAR